MPTANEENEVGRSFEDLLPVKELNEDGMSFALFPAAKEEKEFNKSSERFLPVKEENEDGISDLLP